MLPARDLRALPKAHLHLHLEGAMRPDTLAELCSRYGIMRPADTRGRRFDNFGGFLQMYRVASQCIRSREDLARLILEVAEDAAEQGAVWIEPAFDADRYSILRDRESDRVFETAEQCWRFALQAAERASLATGVGIGFISALDRSKPPEQGLERAKLTARLVRAGEHMIRGRVPGCDGPYPGIIALGLHGNEEGFPPEPFAEAFRIGTNETGLLATPHAGEIAPFPAQGPASVTGAIDRLGAKRVQHGVLAAEDAVLVDRLARERICLDVCPSSNILLSVFPSIEAHPLPRLLEAGVPCSIGSDDPLLFGPDLVDEYDLCRSRMGLSDDRIAALARTSFEFSGAPHQVKAAGIASVDKWLGTKP